MWCGNFGVCGSVKWKNAASDDTAFFEDKDENCAGYLVAVVAGEDSVFAVVAAALSASTSARKRRGGTSCGARGAFCRALLTFLPKLSRLKRASPTTGGAVTWAAVA